MILTQREANKLAEKYKTANTLVISSSGDVYVNTDVDDACSEIKAEKKKFFIIKGSPKEKDKK